MFCPKCSGDKFKVVKTHRRKRFLPDKGKWTYSDNHDTRELLCRACHPPSIWFEESVIICEAQNKKGSDGIGLFDGIVEEKS